MSESSTLVPGGAADPPPRFARRRAGVILPTAPVPVPVPVLVPVPVPVLVPVPGVWFVWKNLDLGGRKIYPSGWPAHAGS